MLHLMLGASNHAFAVGEALNWFRPVKEHHFQLSCACENEDCPQWSNLRAVRESHFHEAVAQETGARFIIDSSKEISWLIDTRRWARRSSMSVVNVFVWKDPVDLAYSFWKRTGDPLLWRSEFLKYYRRIKQSGLPMVTVNLNEVLAAPSETIARLCRVIGIDYVEGMERFWEFEHHHLFGSYGVRKQTQIGDSFFQPQSFPAEFTDQAQRLQRELEDDQEIIELIAYLRRSDVSAYGGETFVERPVQLSHPFPLWYYGQKTKRRMRRYRPEKKDLNRSHSVATIPVEEPSD